MPVGPLQASERWQILGLGCIYAPDVSLGLQTNSGRELVLHKSLIEMWWGEGNGMLLKRKQNQNKKNPLLWVYLPLRSFESFSKDGLVRKPMRCSLPTWGTGPSLSLVDRIGGQVFFITH